MREIQKKGKGDAVISNKKYLLERDAFLSQQNFFRKI